VRTQLGVQGHGFEALRVLREWIEAGAAGRVERVVLWADRMKPKGGWQLYLATSQKLADEVKRKVQTKEYKPSKIREK
jgi:hypothetical protein